MVAPQSLKQLGKPNAVRLICGASMHQAPTQICGGGGGDWRGEKNRDEHFHHGYFTAKAGTEKTKLKIIPLDSFET